MRLPRLNPLCQKSRLMAKRDKKPTRPQTAEGQPRQVVKAARSATEKMVAVKVSAAKGRPMLTWVGKRPLGQVQAFPAQAVERFEAGPLSPKVDWSGWPAKYPQGGLLYHGDNKEVLIHLLANGFRAKVQLIYIDPPFDSGADYVRKVTLRGPSGTAKVDGETYTLGEQIQYQDIWANDNYLQFMYERLLLMRHIHGTTRKSLKTRNILKPSLCTRSHPPVRFGN